MLAAEAERLLGKTTGWNVIALIATYKRPEDTRGEGHIANVVAMRSKDDALDFVMLIERLRTLASELEQVARGERPLPPQEPR